MMPNEPEALLVLPHLRVQNANSISSPMTWGFPAATAFTGFAHALQRRLVVEFDIELDGVGVVCHHFEAQISQPAGRRTFTFNLTRNPVGKDGATAAIVEEGRAHLDVSLVIGVRGAGLYGGEDPQTIANRAWHEALGMRIAGGSVVPPTTKAGKRGEPSLHSWPGSFDDRRRLSRKLALRLLPGFALVSRESLLQQHLEAMRTKYPDANVVDALLDLSRLNIDPSVEDTENGTPCEWRIRRKTGWLVPIPVGYAAISSLYAPGEVKNARDPETPFRFVESIFSVGEWISPHRVESISHLLWQHCAEPDAGLYRCTTPFFATH